MATSPLVSTDWLEAHLGDDDLVVIDCRWYLAPFDLRDGDDEYAKAHIPGAVHLLWNRELADVDRPSLGMLAPAERYAAVMGASGVGDDTMVVVYDDQQVTVAARTWWTLRTYGHDRVAVLDGGFEKWRAEGRPLTDAVPEPVPAVFTPRFRSELYAERDDVMAAIDDDETALVDGRMTPAQLEDGGLIPNSVHLPGVEFIRDDGTWPEADESRSKIEAAGAFGQDRVIAYCRGGVGATGTALAYAIAGRDDVAVYDGSWSDWILDPAAPRTPLGDDT